MSLIDRIKAHSEPERRRRLEVPEWGEIVDGKIVPLVITYSMVNLDDLAVVHEMDGQSWQKQAARIVAMKACDETGKRLFKTVDAPMLTTVAAPDVVNRIATQMVSRISIDAAAKN